MEEPNLDQWKHLYEVAIAVKALAPWEWLLENEIFGIIHPKTPNPIFVSVMGNLGEHLAIAAYLGEESIHGFWSYQYEAQNPFHDPTRILELNHLQASFEDRTELSKDDRATIKSLNLKFRGKKAYPQFRAYHPAHFPWKLNADEAEIMTLVLEQTLVVAPMLKQNPHLFDPYDEEHFFMRVKTENGWENQDRHIPAPPARALNVKKDAALFKAFKALPQAKTHLEVGFFMSPSPVQEKRGEHPYFPYILMIIEPSNQIMLSIDLHPPFPDLHTMYQTIPLALVNTLHRFALRPKQIRVTAHKLYTGLKQIEGDLGVEIKHSDYLLSIEEAKAELFSFRPF